MLHFLDFLLQLFKLVHIIQRVLLVLTIAKADNTYHNIHVAWKKIDSAQSYRIAYRQKGTSKWYYEVTDQASNAITGITRNRSYEVKLQALNGREEGPWSAIKTVFLK